MKVKVSEDLAAQAKPWWIHSDMSAAEEFEVRRRVVRGLPPPSGGFRARLRLLLLRPRPALRRQGTPRARRSRSTTRRSRARSPGGSDDPPESSDLSRTARRALA
jgi:hypothetical protein